MWQTCCPFTYSGWSQTEEKVNQLDVFERLSVDFSFNFTEPCELHVPSESFDNQLVMFCIFLIVNKSNEKTKNN